MTYRGKVGVPPLEMVDDIVTASTCGSTAVALNQTVNTFVDLKKLKLSKNKCSKIHVGTKQKQCPEHLVHGEVMKSSDKDKYLGDFLTNKANSKGTIEDRDTRGNAIVSQMSAMLQDIPLGNRRIEAGIVLRRAWFLNGCLFNSEVWTGYTDQDMHALEVIDHQILRLILGAQAKAPVEMLYLETAELPIKSVMSVRRMLYLQTILKRHDNELTKRVYTAMKENPVKGDWINLVKEDLDKINMSLDQEELIITISISEFKSIVKRGIRKYALNILEKKKHSHEKVRHITHTDLKTPQEYLSSNSINNKTKALLFNLRSRSKNEFRDNFHNKYQSIDCPMCGKEDDKQEHALSCEETTQHFSKEELELVSTLSYNDLFSSPDRQALIGQLFQRIISIRQTTMQHDQGLPRLQSGPCG